MVSDFRSKAEKIVPNHGFLPYFYLSKQKHDSMLRIPKTLILTLFIGLIILSFNSCTKRESKALISFVNPLIGTGGHGHTYPGASVPFGMVQLSPDTRLTGWDGCSGYHYSDSVVYGFSHTHLSGTGISDYGDILLMPTDQSFQFEEGKGNYGYESSFSHQNEIAEPAYYSVMLDRYQIKTELTATKRTGMHRYLFPETAIPQLILDLKHRDRVLESSIEVIGDNEIVGKRRSRGWAQDQFLFYVIQFSKPFELVQLYRNDSLMEVKSVEGANLKAAIRLMESPSHSIVVKVGISAVSIDGARKNLQQENPDWDFDKIKTESQNDWEKELNKIVVQGGTQEQKEIFYTSLYHSFLNPNLFMDVDGKYRGTDLKVHQAKGFENYTIFSLWDTFRATHPLFTLTQQKRTGDFIHTFMHQYKNGGQLPVWELAGNYTGCMIGYHSIPVIVDAYFKGILNYDANEVYQAMKHSADQDHLGLDAYKKNGLIAINDESDAVSKTLEYAYDDWCIAQMAKDLGYDEDYKRYIERAQSYKNIFNPANGFMQPKKENIWKNPFDPREVDFNFTEANSWQYSFFVPHDVEGLIKMHGGDEPFVTMLDSLFSASSETLGRHQSDITGLIGQYAHGNEPSHHMAYLYNYAGQAWKSQKIIRKIMDELYSNQPDGLSGNEDCGQMSSWYVLSAMGFYSVTPGSVDYIIGTPIFETAALNLENGKQFVVEAKGVSDKNIYIQSANLNDVNYNKSYITQTDIMAGGSLVFQMGPKPNKEWASKKEDRPKSAITDYLIQPIPFVEAKTKVFTDSLIIGLGSPVSGAEIYYTLDGSVPNKNAKMYKVPFAIHQSRTLKLIAYAADLPASKVIESSFIRIEQTQHIQLISKYSNQYNAGGDQALIDYIIGGDDFRDGTWQGYEAQDFVAIIDLGEKQRVNTITTGFLQSIRSWIWMPTEVEYLISNDGKNFKFIGIVENSVVDNNYENTRKEFSVHPKNTSARYVKVIAKNYGTIPEWHLGTGGQAWIFVDEIRVK